MYLDSLFHSDVTFSSEINVSFPRADGEYVKTPIPEQYTHSIKGEKIESAVSGLYS